MGQGAKAVRVWSFGLGADDTVDALKVSEHDWANHERDDNIEEHFHRVHQLSRQAA